MERLQQSESWTCTSKSEMPTQTICSWWKETLSPLQNPCSLGPILHNTSAATTGHGSWDSFFGHREQSTENLETQQKWVWTYAQKSQSSNGLKPPCWAGQIPLKPASLNPNLCASPLHWLQLLKPCGASEAALKDTFETPEDGDFPVGTDQFEQTQVFDRLHKISIVLLAQPMNPNYGQNTLILLMWRPQLAGIFKCPVQI